MPKVFEGNAIFALNVIGVFLLVLYILCPWIRLAFFKPMMQKVKQISLAQLFLDIGAKTDEKIMCPICTVDFEESENPVQLKCSKRHVFHQDCLKSWVEDNNKTTCPICRQIIK